MNHLPSLRRNAAVLNDMDGGYKHPVVKGLWVGETWSGTWNCVANLVIYRY